MKAVTITTRIWRRNRFKAIIIIIIVCRARAAPDSARVSATGARARSPLRVTAAPPQLPRPHARRSRRPRAARERETRASGSRGAPPDEATKACKSE
eukprot:729953-Pleurochrysis_carterae.AAC.1